MRYATFALLYFAQGSIMGYFTALNALYLMSFDVSMTQIGLMGTIVMIPFILKVFLGMLSDRINFFGFGHRKPYIIIGLLIQAVCLLIVPGINPGKNFLLFAALAFLLQTGMALYDTCTDGLALDTTPLEDEGIVQGIMVGGRALGVIMIGIIALLVYRTSWNAAFIVLFLLTLLPLPFLLWGEKEPERSSEHRFEWRAFASFSRKSIIMLGVLGALYSLIINGANEIVNPFLNTTFGINVATAGWLTTIWGVGVVIGGLTGGRLTDRIGHRQSVIWATGIAFITILALSFIISPLLAWGLVPLFGLAYGYYETVYFAVSMRASDPRIAASMFAILMAVANIGTGIGLGLSGVLVDGIGYRWTFAILAIMNLLALPLLSTIFPRQSQPSLEKV